VGTAGYKNRHLEEEKVKDISTGDDQSITKTKRSGGTDWSEGERKDGGEREIGGKQGARKRTR